MSQAQPTVAEMPAPETQAERWLKYGGNVVLASFVVILLAVLAIYLVQRSPKRLDTTAAGLYSLKPQTVNIIKDNPQKIKIISLYTKSKLPKNPDEEAGDQAKADPAAQVEKVSDLLEEYRSKGKNIDVEDIDPDANPAKVESLTDEVVDKYGGRGKKERGGGGTGWGKDRKSGAVGK